MNLVDKATEAEALAGTADNKWMTPAKVKKAITSTEDPIGTIRYSYNNLEVESGGKYIAADGRNISVDEYKEYIDLYPSINARFPEAVHHVLDLSDDDITSTSNTPTLLAVENGYLYFYISPNSTKGVWVVDAKTAAIKRFGWPSNSYGRHFGAPFDGGIICIDADTDSKVLRINSYTRSSGNASSLGTVSVPGLLSSPTVQVFHEQNKCFYLAEGGRISSEYTISIGCIDLSNRTVRFIASPLTAEELKKIKFYFSRFSYHPTEGYFLTINISGTIRIYNSSDGGVSFVDSGMSYTVPTTFSLSGILFAEICGDYLAIGLSDSSVGNQSYSSTARIVFFDVKKKAYHAYALVTGAWVTQCVTTDGELSMLVRTNAAPFEVCYTYNPGRKKLTSVPLKYQVDAALSNVSARPSLVPPSYSTGFSNEYLLINILGPTSDILPAYNTYSIVGELTSAEIGVYHIRSNTSVGVRSAFSSRIGGAIDFFAKPHPVIYSADYFTSEKRYPFKYQAIDTAYRKFYQIKNGYIKVK